MKELDIRQMVKYIDEHITDHISLTNVAQHVNYSPYYCSVCFKESIGTSIKSYILKKRLHINMATPLKKHSQERFQLFMASHLMNIDKKEDLFLDTILSMLELIQMKG